MGYHLLCCTTTSRWNSCYTFWVGFLSDRRNNVTVIPSRLSNTSVQVYLSSGYMMFKYLSRWIGLNSMKTSKRSYVYLVALPKELTTTRACSIVKSWLPNMTWDQERYLIYRKQVFQCHQHWKVMQNLHHPEILQVSYWGRIGRDAATDPWWTWSHSDQLCCQASQ